MTQLNKARPDTLFQPCKKCGSHLVNGSFCKQQDSSSAPDSASLVSNFKKYETCKPIPSLLA